MALHQQFFGTVMDHLAGMKEAKSLGSEQRHIDEFNQTSAAIKETLLRHTRARENTTLAYKVGSAGFLSLLLYLAVELLQVPLVALMLLIIIFARLSLQLRGIHTGYQEVLHMIPAFGLLTERLENLEAAQESKPGSPPEPLQLKRELWLEDVSFRYDKSGATWGLQGVDFRIAAGSTVGVVGPSGAGKTTLADLLMGLFAADRGTVYADGVALVGDRVFAWRQTIGYVPQETFLLHDTIRANLLWARPRARESDLQEALQLAAADEFVAALPLGLDTIVGDRGVCLSGGERQRIALARALLRHPSLLILDEATSALDPENERRIQDAISRLRGELTIVVIAHRLSTVRTADQILVLDSGRLVENGTYDELAARTQGRFRALIEADRGGASAG